MTREIRLRWKKSSSARKTETEIIFVCTLTNYWEYIWGTSNVIQGFSLLTLCFQVLATDLQIDRNFFVLGDWGGIPFLPLRNGVRMGSQSTGNKVFNEETNLKFIFTLGMITWNDKNLGVIHTKRAQSKTPRLKKIETCFRKFESS